MIEKRYPNGLILRHFSRFSGYDDKLRHFVSGREGGLSEGDQGSLNLSFSVGDPEENVVANRSLLAQAIGASQVLFPKQVHSAIISIVTRENHALVATQEADALITREQGLCIAVMAADCAPVLLYDPVNKAIAAIHAGWRGTVAGIVSRAIHTLMETCQSKPENIIAGIGPSICQDQYEVGEEVMDAVDHYYGPGSGLYKTGTKAGKAYLDLWRANKKQLLDNGVPEANIELSGICTYSSSDTFFSARRSPKSGRFAAGIMLL